MKKIAISFLFLSLASVSMAQLTTNFEAKADVQSEQTYLGPINPGNADNY